MNARIKFCPSIHSCNLNGLCWLPLISVDPWQFIIVVASKGRVQHIETAQWCAWFMEKSDWSNCIEAQADWYFVGQVSLWSFVFNWLKFCNLFLLKVQMLTEMGFNDAQVRQALQMCNNDLNTATNFLLQHS